MTFVMLMSNDITHGTFFALLLQPAGPKATQKSIQIRLTDVGLQTWCQRAHWLKADRNPGGDVDAGHLAEARMAK